MVQHFRQPLSDLISSHHSYYEVKGSDRCNFGAILILALLKKQGPQIKEQKGFSKIFRQTLVQL